MAAHSEDFVISTCTVVAYMLVTVLIGLQRVTDTHTDGRTYDS